MGGPSFACRLMFYGIDARAQVNEWISSSILLEPSHERTFDKNGLRNVYSLSQKICQRLRQLKFIREYRDIFDLTKPLNNWLSGAPWGQCLTAWTLHAYSYWGKTEQNSHIFGIAPARHFQHTLRLLFKWWSNISPTAYTFGGAYIRQIIHGTTPEKTTYLKNESTFHVQANNGKHTIETFSPALWKGKTRFFVVNMHW